jgi:hypothetical protein
MQTRETCIEWLKQGIVEVNFKKKDGSSRRMVCTLHPKHLPEKQQLIEGALQRKVPDSIIAVWSVEDKGWRSFNYDQLISLNVMSVE